MKYSIEDLRNGKVAVINDGTVEELRRVLKEAFPNDDSRIEGISDYYYKSKNYNYWCCDASTILPTQSVKDFLKDETKEEEFKWGDDVECSNDKKIWLSGVYIGESKYNYKYPNIVESVDGGYGTSYWPYIRKPLKKTELTRQQIAEKFNIPVEQLVIKD